MRATLRRMIAILDGTPTRARGQSLVELTLTLPVLLIMILGLTEIGWYANNYLNLLDIVREAGRQGSTRDPMTWVDGQEKNYNQMDCEELSDRYDKLPFENNTTWPGPDLSGYGYQDRGERRIGYYDYVACSVIGNMSPMVFDDEKDDIVVSVFQFLVTPKTKTGTLKVKIVGRLPARANECQGDDAYDPFDWNPRNGTGNDAGEVTSSYDSEWDNVRGYCFRCNHQMDYGGGVPCLGSEFSTAEVEAMLNFDGDADQQRKLAELADFGLVLAEIYWTHYQLLGLPFFNIGPIDDGMTIHVWTFFPVSAAEPKISDSVNY